MRLNLGCGSVRTPGYVNVDRMPVPGVDVVHDLDVIPWPWDDAEVKAITGVDVFEHVSDPIGFMTESHRVLESGGELVIKSPHVLSLDAFTDPTHRRFCTENTWDYWIGGTVLYERHNAAYGGVRFALVRRETVMGSIFIQLRKV